ncbi:MAG: cobalt ECF transporter T component CbiQ [Caldilineales bacterium]|nr:cobalt ECF transporter T component CbiQ [Caldilineales bacterium]MCW5856827.1 cobalt ECF transporter T component CbiQ [Caldilineales bacterium]
MHSDVIDRYVAGDSLIHRLDPRVKVVATVLFIVSNVLLPDGAWIGFALAFAWVLLTTRLAGLPAGYAVRRSFVALPFALVGITTLFSIPGEALAALRLGPWTLTISDAGLLRFSSLVSRTLLSVMMAILLTAATQFPDLIHALRHLRLPASLVTVIAFMYRYLFVLSDEVGRLLRAREARSARLPGRKSGSSVVWRAKVAGNMAGQLFVRSFDRSDRVYNAMLARGYRGHFYTLNPHVMDVQDWLLFGLTIAGLLVIQIGGRLPLP